MVKPEHRLALLVAALLMLVGWVAASPFDDAGAPAKPPQGPTKPNLLDLMKGAPPMDAWEKQWQAAPSDEPNALAAAGLRAAMGLTRKEQVAQAKDPEIGGTRKDLLLTMDVARHELLKHAIQTAIKQANAELAAAGYKKIEKVMVSNCSPLGDGTRDADLTVRAEDEVREAALFRHLAGYFDLPNNPNVSTKLSALDKTQGKAFSVEGLEVSFHRGQNDVPPPHVPMDLANFAITYRRTIEHQFENPEAYLGFGFEQEVQGRQGLRLAGKHGPLVLLQTFTASRDGAAGYNANLYRNQKEALDAMRTTLGPDYTEAHNAMHVFCDFLQASHHAHETDLDISKGPIKYAQRALDAICRLHGFDEWKKLTDKSRLQVMQLALGPGFSDSSNLPRLGELMHQLDSSFGKSGPKVGDSATSAIAMSFLRRASARALQQVARVMMDPPPIRPPQVPVDQWNGLNRQEQDQLARTDPEYQKRVAVAAMENLVIATRLLAQIDLEAGTHGPTASPFGTMALRQVIEETKLNPRLQRVLQLAADHAQVDAAIERNCPPGVKFPSPEYKAWAAQKKAAVAQRSKLRYDLAMECAAFRDSPDRKAVEWAMGCEPNDLLKKSNERLIPLNLLSLDGKRGHLAQMAMGGDDPAPAWWRAAQYGKKAAGWALSHAADPNNLPDMLSLVEMVEDGAGEKDYARFLVRTVAGRFNAVLGYAVGATEISTVHDPAEQDRQLKEMGKGVVFDVLARYIPGLAQAKLAFDIEKGIVNVTYGYEIKALNNSTVDALYLGEAGRIGPGRAGTLSGWVRDAVDPVLPEAYVVHRKDEGGKEQIDINCVRLYEDKFKEWTGRAHDDIGRTLDLKPKSLALVKAHDRLVTVLQDRAEGNEPGWFNSHTVGLYQESDLDAAIRELTALLDPLVRPMVNNALNSVPQIRTYTEKRGDGTVNVIEEGLVGRLSADFISGLQSEWNTIFMKQRQLKRNLDGLMSTAVSQALADTLADPSIHIVTGQALPKFEIEVQARTPDGSLLWELDGGGPLPLICQLKANGEMPDDAPDIQIVLQTGALVPVPDSYRPYRGVPAGDFPVAAAQKDPSLWSNGVFRQPLAVQGVLVGSGQVIAEKKVELLVRLTPKASLRIDPATAQGLTRQPVNFTIKGSAIPAQPRFEWDMGDGGKPSTQEPKLAYTYTKEGNYKVTVKLYDGGKVYIGGAKAPVLGEASGTVAIQNDKGLKHHIDYFNNDPKRPASEYWYREDNSGRRTLEIKEGEERRWYENGQLAERQTWQNGQHNGPIELYYENGKPQTTCSAKNDKMNGHAVTYYENGQKQEEGNVVDDQKIGDWTAWDQWGRVCLSESYNNKHQLNGTKKQWTTLAGPDGQKPAMYLSSMVEYVDGESVHIIDYDAKGKVTREWRK